MNPHAKATCDFELSGEVISKPESRHRSEGGVMQPVLCFEVQTDSSTGAICHVQQLFAQGHEAQCQAAARRLHKGDQVTFIAPSVGIELVARNVSHVHVHKAEAPAAMPTNAPAEQSAQAALI